MQKSSDPKSIKQCFQTSSLKLIMQKAQQILAVKRLLNHILPQEIIPYYRIMNLSQETLILQLENAAWATRVRYLIPHLLKQFSQKGIVGIHRVQCQIRPDLYTQLER